MVKEMNSYLYELFEHFKSHGDMVPVRHQVNLKFVSQVPLSREISRHDGFKWILVNVQVKKKLCESRPNRVWQLL